MGQAAQVSSLERDRSGLRRSKFASTCSNALISNTCHRFFLSCLLEPSISHRFRPMPSGESSQQAVSARIFTVNLQCDLIVRFI